MIATYNVLWLIGPNLIDEVEANVDQGQSPGLEFLLHLQPRSCAEKCGVGTHLRLA